MTILIAWLVITAISAIVVVVLFHTDAPRESWLIHVTDRCNCDKTAMMDSYYSIGEYR